MIVIGLTGSIGMGKSTVAQRLRDRGFPVFDADAEVHRLYAGPAVSAIEAAFPGTTGQDGVDRSKLAAVLQSDRAAFERLETIVHPLVRQAEWRFLQDQEKAGAKAAVLEIPLLFETGADRLTDADIVVTAPEAVQRARVLERPGMTDARLDAILANQMPDREKRGRADYVVDSGQPLEAMLAQVDRIAQACLERRPQAMLLWRRGTEVQTRGST
ncbi:MAG: dephospho-CoA kinase [Pseudomonadota bacterium]|nr:dephospho-CoA kinase [Pseudomonadota bacterium]